MTLTEHQQWLKYFTHKHPEYFGCRYDKVSGGFQLFFRDRPVSPLLSFEDGNSMVWALHTLDHFAMGMGEISWMEEAWRINNNGMPIHSEWAMSDSYWFTWKEREEIISLINININEQQHREEE